MGVKARYIASEAWSISRSGPRQTAISILLVALSLYVPGLLLLISQNLARLAASQGDPVALVVTLDPAADARALAGRLATDRRVAVVRIVSSAAATERFRKTYPDLGAALTGLDEAPFPPTLEVTLRPGAPRGTEREIASGAKSWPGVEAAEPEEEFGRKFRDAVKLLRGAGIFLGAVLAVAAVLSVASAIRLALDLHRDEIEIMRLMGATEGAIRAPFWLYASGEGLVGGTLALALLYATYRGAGVWLSREPHPVVSALWARFLDAPAAAALPAVGLLAGFVGSLMSLGRHE